MNEIAACGAWAAIPSIRNWIWNQLSARRIWSDDRSSLPTSAEQALETTLPEHSCSNRNVFTHLQQFIIAWLGLELPARFDGVLKGGGRHGGGGLCLDSEDS